MRRPLPPEVASGRRQVSGVCGRHYNMVTPGGGSTARRHRDHPGRWVVGELTRGGHNVHAVHGDCQLNGGWVCRGGHNTSELLAAEHRRRDCMAAEQALGSIRMEEATACHGNDVATGDRRRCRVHRRYTQRRSVEEWHAR